MSTFTVVHHTAPHIPFKPAESWNAAQAQLAGTVHCDFPAWCAKHPVESCLCPLPALRRIRCLRHPASSPCCCVALFEPSAVVCRQCCAASCAPPAEVSLQQRIDQKVHRDTRSAARWSLCRVEFLTHDISVHVPHHVNSKIPWYNLRKANESLKANWGQVRRPSPPVAAGPCDAVPQLVISLFTGHTQLTS